MITLAHHRYHYCLLSLFLNSSICVSVSIQLMEAQSAFSTAKTQAGAQNWALKLPLKSLDLPLRQLCTMIVRRDTTDSWKLQNNFQTATKSWYHHASPFQFLFEVDVYLSIWESSRIISGLWSSTNQMSTPALCEELERNISNTLRGETPASLAIAALIASWTTGRPKWTNSPKSTWNVTFRKSLSWEEIQSDMSKTPALGVSAVKR